MLTDDKRQFTLFSIKINSKTSGRYHFKKGTVRSPYFVSAACNSHLTNKPETDGAPSISAAFYGCLQLLKAK